MKVLMLGWEFPLDVVGGVGIVCYEMLKEFQNHPDVQISYVMPYPAIQKNNSSQITFNSVFSEKHFSSNIKTQKVPGNFQGYQSCGKYLDKAQDYMEFEKLLLGESNNFEIKKTIQRNKKNLYGADLISEIYLFAKRVADLYKDKDFDVIHAHDWTTIPAALLLKQLTGKPVIFHIHITELDKTGGAGGWSEVFNIEKLGFEMADVLVPVSNMVKNRLINDYGISENKIKVIHNGGVSDLIPCLKKQVNQFSDKKTVLFAGRVTKQKGPEYFLHMAKRVLDYNPNVHFIMAGSGDMLDEMVELANTLGISQSIYFHGKYSREEADMYFSSTDVFVMPSISEPFGIVPLEAVVKGTPTIISKQSGISEVLINTFKVDFWDIDEMANKVLSLLEYPHLHSHMRNLAFSEFRNFTWEGPINKFKSLYHNLLLYHGD